MPQYSLSVRLSDSSTFAVNVDADPTVFTVADLKKAVQAGEAAAAAAAAAGGNGGTSGAAAGGTPPDLQKLVYKGRILKDADTMEQYGEGARARAWLIREARACARVAARPTAARRRPFAGIESGHTLHLVKSRPAAAAASPAAAPAASGASFARVFGGAGGGEGGGAGGAGGGGMDEAMRAMMESPMMASLFDNPEVSLLQASGRRATPNFCVIWGGARMNKYACPPPPPPRRSSCGRSSRPTPRRGA
jgi:hypothetical protein